MASPLWVGAVLPILTTGLLAYAGVLVLRKRVAPGDRLARLMFAAWWFAAGVVLLLASLPTLLSIVGAADRRILDASRWPTAAALAVALCGLLYYLLYIYTGRHRLIVPLAIAYAAFFVFEIYYFAQFGPPTLEVTAWTVRATPSSQPPSWMSATFGVAVALPILAAIAAYASLLFRAKEAEHRFRIKAVSAAFSLWFGPLLLAYLAGWDDADWFPLIYQAPGLVAGILIVLAYRPPRALAKRWVVTEDRI